MSFFSYFMSLSSTHTRRTLIPNLRHQPSSTTGQIHLQDITKLTIIERPTKKCKLVFGTLSLSLSQESNWASMAAALFLLGCRLHSLIHHQFHLRLFLFQFLSLFLCGFGFLLDFSNFWKQFSTSKINNALMK